MKGYYLETRRGIISTAICFFSLTGSCEYEFKVVLACLWFKTIF